jgi:hypothetical protein
MAEGMLQTWQEQACVACDSVEFVARLKLLAKPGGGVTQTPVGFQCAKCGTVADVAAMQRHAARKQRLEELRALEAEINDIPVEAVPSFLRS